MLLTPEQLAVATPEERLAYAKALELAVALASPLDYAQHVSKRTERYRHTELLSSLIVRLVTGRLIHPRTGMVVRKLGISMGPRHGKSYVVSDHTPPWAITKWADHGFRVGLASYEADVAAGWGRKARAHIREHPEFGVQIDNTRSAADAWDVLATVPGAPAAGMDTAGVGGPLTSKGFHLLVIDDPIKNNEWAMSQTIRDKQWEWLGSTALTRLEPTFEWTDPLSDQRLEVGGAVILMNTRWHEDELIGRAMRDEPDAWYFLNLKALADDTAPDGDPLGRQPGEALCPERFDEKALNKIRNDPSTGGYWWSAMYQGEPNIEGGGIFKRPSFRYHRPAGGDAGASHLVLRETGGNEVFVPREGLSRFSTLDVAATTKTSSDWSVLATWDVTPDRRLLLIDRVRQRMESADLTNWVHEHYHRLKPSYIGIGAKTFGLSVITELTRMSVPVRALAENDDKFSRAITAGNLIDQGRVFFPAGAPWLQEWESELLAFDKGAHDDQVDVMSLAAREVALGPWSTPARQVAAGEDRSLEARIQRYMDSKRKRKHGWHPELGRL